ncbi:MAG: hypothetical protein LBL79_09600 [Prevotella sp.]|jgi:hypothetical protein|nr:hypothetical protein [Prevotella sp.]
MKTIKITLIALASILMASCESYYRVVTTLDSDGKAYREIYTKGDSAFIAGDMSKNPYLFDISDWDIVRLDTVNKYDFFGKEAEINVKVKKTVASIDLFSKSLRYGEDKKSFAAPEESLSKKFRWFYTNYKFAGVYKKVTCEVPVSIDKYLTKEEQKIWSQGDFSKYKALNGSELNDRLGDLESKFMEWYSRNSFEMSLTGIKKYSDKNIPDTDKDIIYKQILAYDQTAYPDITPESICKAMDMFYKTNSYSRLYDSQKEEIDKVFDEADSFINILGNVIRYELVVPGEIIESNSPMISSGILTWKIDGVRLLFDDYTLTAEYRIVNVWAFIVSGLIVVIAIFSCLLLMKKKMLKKLKK